MHQARQPDCHRVSPHHGFTWQPHHGSVLLCGVDADGTSADMDTSQVRALLTELSDIAEEI